MVFPLKTLKTAKWTVFWPFTLKGKYAAYAHNVYYVK